MTQNYTISGVMASPVFALLPGGYAKFKNLSADNVWVRFGVNYALMAATPSDNLIPPKTGRQFIRGPHNTFSAIAEGPAPVILQLST
jgi:hypothetical protein